ncbi:hypothetical protein QFC22_003524 [Naganishia vaughanmartiniae]|uniref:Uncharacterized protein n=1 Tax=Naganishia vaughanmartiniae TaxID=1424756 RepID=A0ACC2X4T5_9TREE|nr:hypothetical protein QFC22_003524 [Naganishia vaughanmartiniae]
MTKTYSQSSNSSWASILTERPVKHRKSIYNEKAIGHDRASTFGRITRSLLPCLRTDRPDSTVEGPRIPSMSSQSLSETSTMRTTLLTESPTIASDCGSSFTAKPTDISKHDPASEALENQITEYVVTDWVKDESRRYDTDECITVSLHGVPKLVDDKQTFSRLSFVADYRCNAEISNGEWDSQQYWEIYAYGISEDLGVTQGRWQLDCSKNHTTEKVVIRLGNEKQSVTDRLTKRVNRMLHVGRHVPSAKKIIAEEGVTDGSPVDTKNIVFVVLVALRSLINTLSKKNKESIIASCKTIGMHWVTDEGLTELQAKLECKVKELMEKSKSTP